MIHRVWSDQASFRGVSFAPGMNVVLAERTKEATQKDSRNGLGKSTLVEVIHFCLGAQHKRGSGLLVEPLSGWEFSVEFDLRGRRIVASRSTDRPKEVALAGDLSGWPILDAEERDDRTILGMGAWNDLLSWGMFDYRANRAVPNAPTFRSLISYFVRRGRDAFSTPFEHFRKQQEWDKRVNTAFLLNLEWQHAKEWQDLRDKEKALTDLRQVPGLMPGLVGSVGELTAEKVRLEQDAARRAGELASFRVHPEYEVITREVNDLTEQIHGLVLENQNADRILRFYRGSFEAEVPPEEFNVAEIYREAGVHFSGGVQRHLEEVEAFHRQVIANRRDFLGAEVGRLERAILERERAITQYGEVRASKMAILRDHGALSEYTTLQERHLRAQQELEDVGVRLDALRRLERGASELRREREDLLTRALADYEAREEQRKAAIALFNENSERLYQTPGNLVIDLGKNGFRFDVEIMRQGSAGVQQMKVFCYDLALASLWAQRPVSPGFLVHDSPLFADVDERQIASALELAAEQSQGYGFQYICMLNSDKLPLADFSAGFSLEPFVRLRLTDASTDGGLLGIRY